MAAHRLTIAKVKLALEQTGGIKAAAARLLKCSRTTLYAFIDRHPELEEFIAAVDEAVKDLAEAELLKLIRDGDAGSIRFYLERKARDRGFGHRVENVGKNGGPIENVTKVTVDYSALSDEDLRAMRLIHAKLAVANGASIAEAAGGTGMHGDHPTCDCAYCKFGRELRQGLG